MEHCFSERWHICTSNEVYCSHWYGDFFQGYTVPENPVKYEFPAIYIVTCQVIYIPESTFVSIPRPNRIIKMCLKVFMVHNQPVQSKNRTTFSEAQSSLHYFWMQSLLMSRTRRGAYTPL